MKYLYMLVGPAGCGKSTYAKKMEQMFKSLYEVKIFSSDEYRGKLFGDENDQTHNDEVFKVMHKDLRHFLEQKIDEKNTLVAIYDATNLTAKTRKTFLRSIGGIKCTKCCVVVPASYEQCLARQTMRERKVPAYVIQRQIKQFQTPMPWEGWDTVEIAKCDNEKLNLPDLFKMSHIPHENHHHSKNVDEHMSLAAVMAELAGESPEIVEALALHDIGKPVVKDKHNKKGEPTEEAHYYNHDNVGAYMILLCKPEQIQQKRLNLSALICYHMKPYFGGLDKFKADVGEEFYEKIMKMNKYDKMAH